MLNIFIHIVFVWFLILHLYIALTHIQVVKERQSLTLFWKIHIYPVIPVFLFLDGIANILVGLIQFRELPQWHKGEFMLSKRIQRHYSDPTSPKHEIAVWWAKQLNLFDEDHIK